MIFDKKSTKKDFWREVFKIFGIIAAVIGSIGLLAIGATYAIHKMGNWSLIPLVILLCFAGSIIAAYIEWEDR